MTTGSVLLTPGAAWVPDGSASNLAPQITRVKSSGTAPGVYFPQLLYDAATDEWACWAFRMPADYASGPVLKIQYKMASATSGDVVWDGRLAAVSDGDSTDIDAKVFASANTATVTVPGTAGFLDEASITMTNADNLAAGDFVVLRIARNGSSGSDTATGDAEFIGAALTYTTA
jgi:hypothetical protein